MRVNRHDISQAVEAFLSRTFEFQYQPYTYGKGEKNDKRNVNFFIISKDLRVPIAFYVEPDSEILKGGQSILLHSC